MPDGIFMLLVAPLLFAAILAGLFYVYGKRFGAKRTWKNTAVVFAVVFVVGFAFLWLGR